MRDTHMLEIGCCTLAMLAEDPRYAATVRRAGALKLVESAARIDSRSGDAAAKKRHGSGPEASGVDYSDLYPFRAQCKRASAVLQWSKHEGRHAQPHDSYEGWDKH